MFAAECSQLATVSVRGKEIQIPILCKERHFVVVQNYREKATTPKI